MTRSKKAVCQLLSRRRALPLFAMHTITPFTCSGGIRNSVFHRKQKISSFQLLTLWSRLLLVKLGLELVDGGRYYSKIRPTSINSCRCAGVVMHRLPCSLSLNLTAIFKNGFFFVHKSITIKMDWNRVHSLPNCTQPTKDDESLRNARTLLDQAMMIPV